MKSFDCCRSNYRHTGSGLSKKKKQPVSHLLPHEYARFLQKLKAPEERKNTASRELLLQRKPSSKALNAATPAGKQGQFPQAENKGFPRIKVLPNQKDGT